LGDGDRVGRRKRFFQALLELVLNVACRIGVGATRPPRVLVSALILFACADFLA
jgi:hypothetical protein